jgi:uncharacterized protein with GYD domain
MPKFLFKASYGPEGARGIARQGGSARRDAIDGLFRAKGGTMEGFYFAFGDADAYVFGDLPDVETATAVALAVNQSGSVTVSTVVLLTPEQVDAAAEVDVDYVAPGT